MSRSIPFICLLAGLAMSLSSCLEDKCLATRQYVVYTPVFAKMEEYRTEVQAEAARELRNTGALYVYQQYIFISEQKEGIHIIDNSDPTNPTPVSFLNIPGNFSLAVRNNLLYADSYVDLVVMDISNPREPVFAGRTENVFPSYGYFEDLGHLVFYEAGNETMELSCSDANFGQNFFWLQDRTGGVLVMDVAFSANAAAESGGKADGSSTGVGGSLARFTIVDKYLYSVSEYDLNVFDLSVPTEAELASTVNIGWGIETIFPYGDKLFIGSNSGMFIYDNSNPLQPSLMSTFQHATACDPVYVDGDRAYVTLRDGTECEGFNNQLDVVDVSNLSAPVLLKTHPMQNPHGLSVSDEKLYLCEGRFGFKVFDAAEWQNIGERELAHLGNFNAIDVIVLPDQNLAVVIGEDGLHQFDITDPAKPKALSVLQLGGR